MAESSTGFTAQELADDQSEPRRLLGNAKTCLWDIDETELTPQERRRLETILKKMGELENIIEAREVSEMRAEIRSED